MRCHHYNAHFAAEAEKQVQSLESEQRLEDHQEDSEGISSEERIERKTLSNQARDRHHEVVDEPPTQRPRLENPASVIRWSKTDESGHWSPITVPETEEMWVETDPEILWHQQVDDHVWENTGKPVCLFFEEWSDLFGNTRDNITAYVNFNQSKDTGLTATKMTRNDELPRHLILDSEWPRFLQATVAEWTAIPDTSAITIISPTAAMDTRKDLPHRIVPSRHVYREKPGEGVGGVSMIDEVATLLEAEQGEDDGKKACCIKSFGQTKDVMEEIMEVIPWMPQERTQERIVEETTHVPIPQVMEESIEVVKHIPQEQVQIYTAEQLVSMPVPRIWEETGQVIQLIQQRRIPNRVVEQIVDVLVPKIRDQIVEVVKVITQERLQRHTREQIVHVLVFVQAKVPAVQVAQKTVEVPDGVADTPVAVQHQVPVAPQLQSIDEAAPQERQQHRSQQQQTVQGEKEEEEGRKVEKRKREEQEEEEQEGESQSRNGSERVERWRG